MKTITCIIGTIPKGTYVSPQQRTISSGGMAAEWSRPLSRDVDGIFTIVEKAPTLVFYTFPAPIGRYIGFICPRDSITQQKSITSTMISL